MAFNKIKIVFMIGASLMFYACNSEDPTSLSQPETVATNRLIFIGTADTGGSVKIELNDAKLESVLDGNPNYNGGTLISPPMLPYHKSYVRIDITDLNYYDDVVTISCPVSYANKMPLEWRGNAGSFYENTDGILYVQDLGLPQYFEQQTHEALLEAAIPVPSLVLGAEYNFNTLCSGSDGNDYRISFYDRTSPYAHGITTTFSVVNGTVEGIIRVHRLGDGYHPYLDILL